MKVKLEMLSPIEDSSQSCDCLHPKKVDSSVAPITILSARKGYKGGVKLDDVEKLGLKSFFHKEKTQFYLISKDRINFIP